MMIDTNNPFKKVSGSLTELEHIFVTFFNEHFENAELKLIKLDERYPYFDDAEEFLHVRFVYTSEEELDLKRCLTFSRLISPLLLEKNEERLVVDGYLEYDDYLTNWPKNELVI